ncbi:cytochrome P450 family protein [Abortiporus biennis]
MILEKQIAEILANPTLLKNTSHPIVYDALINGKDTRIPLDKHDLFNEAWLLIFAGMDSSSNVITLGVMHLMENPTIQQKLQQELKNVWPRLDQQPPKFEELEKLPYLKAVIKESLRLAHGVWVPATRIVPSGGLEICGKYIPSGTVVGIATIFVDMNETLFPEPHVFRPERWLEPGAENLDVVAFSKGPRSCLGINLAWCELYIAFASLSRKFKFSPCNGISVESMKFRECYIPHYVGPPLNVVAIPESE